MNTTSAASAGAVSTSTPAPIEVRNLRFDLSEVPKHWHGGRRSISIYFDNLSVFFPVGERFFVSTVKAFRGEVRDPELAEAMAGFCAQEGHHSREHVRYNKHLAAQGYPVERMEASVDRLLRFVTKALSKKRQLAATCALEHFTALMGTLVLEDPRTLEGAHPTMAALWRWHAAEETEHKSVTFDVHQRIGGSWLQRCSSMVLATMIFWAKVFEHQVRMMHSDGILFSLPEWWALVRFLYLSPGGLSKIVLPYFRYFRPDFHPRELDSAALLAEWKGAFASSDEYRRATS